MKRDVWIADTHSERPAGKAGLCFYCGCKLGEEHRQGCVIRSRTVIVEVKTTLLMTVPEDWDEYMVEFHMNDSSSCADNLLAAIDRQFDRMEGCACNYVEGKFVREATAEDEETFKMKIADSES